MKLQVLALVIPALLVAGTAGAAEVYNKDGNQLDLFGSLHGLHYFSDNNSQDGDQTYARIGFKGQTQINDQLTGYGDWEYQIQANHTEGGSDAQDGNHTRYAFAGLKYGDYGSFDYGRNDGILYDITSWTDMQPEFDGSTYGADQFMFGRATGVATYRNKNFFGLVDGLNFAVQYQGQNGSPEENVNGRDVLGQNGDGYGMSLSYDIGWGLSVGGAFFNSKRTDEQNGLNNAGISGRGDNAEGYTGGLKYNANNIYVAAEFTQSYNAAPFGSSDSDVYGYANKAQSFEAYAGYTFDFGLVPFVGYNQTRAENIGAAGDGNTYNNQDLVKFVDLGATYYFNKNISTYVDYKINLIDSSQFSKAAGINTDDVVALGLVYQF
ncbi:porin OmpC [Martelella alba]|uniref:Porin OmpC n=1 Tax=Martelella alba TaxID=2590451 RepID=A0ABY2SJE8_9HYPH|nr:porin OmpC [Martelella alba]TKI04793.1 porin OmpC [Martelella alba]